jgi:hypothetical protein
VFRYGRVVPVRARFAECDGTYPSDLAPVVSVTKLSPAPGGAQPVGGVMTFEDGAYVFELATRDLRDRSGTYRVTVTVPRTGQTVSNTFAVRS